MVSLFENLVTQFEKKYDRKFMLVLAVIWWSYAIYCTLNPASDFDNEDFFVHIVGLFGLYVVALVYSCIFIFWKRFSKWCVSN